VNGRQVSDVLEAFGVDRTAVDAGLRSRPTLDYLASVGYDLRGKRARDLSARETFELLSTREIRDGNQIMDILSSLTDKLAGDQAKQARRRAMQKNRGGRATLVPRHPVPDLKVQGLAVAPASIRGEQRPGTLSMVAQGMSRHHIRGSPAA
jgi:hypothetical protein